MIEHVTKNIENFHFNKAIANIYDFVNSIQKNINDKTASLNSLKNSFNAINVLEFESIEIIKK